MGTSSGTKKGIVSTGNPELDKKLGGGIPLGSLTLIEGESDAGKSVLTQQMIWGSLRNGNKVSVLTTENTVTSLLDQMESLNLDVLDYLLLGRLRFYPIKAMRARYCSKHALRALLEAVHTQAGTDLVVIDSLTSFIAHSPVEDVIGFFEEVKEYCGAGLTMLVVAHSHAFDISTLIRIGSMCDAHVRLTMETMGDRLVKSMEVSKVRGARQSTGNIVTFDVEPGLGMKIIPFSKAQAYEEPWSR